MVDDLPAELRRVIGDGGLEVVVETHPAHVRLTLTGDIDQITAADLPGQVDDIISAGGPVQVEVDAAGVRFLDSAGIRGLLICRSRVRRAGGDLVLTGPSRAVTEVQTMTGLLATFGLE